MVLSSGLAPYDYAAKTPFRTIYPYVGPSGILLEQAQFVITAEIRRFNRLTESHALSNFYVYTNPFGPTSNVYEPKVDGTTLSTSGSINIIDHIEDTREALELLFSTYAGDTDFAIEEHKADWLQQAYPTSPSGFYLAPEFGVRGHYAHRIPSETGRIDYLSDEVLGGSGVLYDIDFGEVMFNPYPYMSSSQAINARGRTSNGLFDPYNILGGPVFPAFQKLDGSLIDLNGFEPTNLVGLYNSLVLPISSGVVRIDGYALRENTDYRFGSYFNFNNNLTFVTHGIRNVGVAGNLDTARVYATPPALTSGVYQTLARNRKVNYSTGAVESGTVSIWPRADGNYYGTGSPGTATAQILDEDFNSGYHAFDETLWITDRTFNSSIARASGLVTLSPWTGHQLWLRYADPEPSPIVDIFGRVYAWGGHIGLERPINDKIIRSHWECIPDLTSNKQTYTFHEYDDLLNYLGDVTSDTNPNTGLGNTSRVEMTDLLYDGNHLFTIGTAGASGLVEFDTSYQYVSSWAVFSPDPSTPGGASGVGSRAFHHDGQYFFYLPQQPGPEDPTGIAVGGLNMRGSGIIEFSFSTGNRVTLDNIKYVRGEKIFGSNIPILWRFHDIVGVQSSPQLTPGIWALCWIIRASEPTLASSNYLMRIEERSDYWEIMSFSRLDHGSDAAEWLGNEGTVDMLYMPL